jgi:hypothetical protein
MEKTIKTQVLDGILEALTQIPEAKTVVRIPAGGLDLDIAPAPVICFYDDVEKRSRRNRLATGIVKIVIFAYVPLTLSDYGTAGELGDIIQGRIHTAMVLNILTGQPLIQEVEEVQILKDYPNDQFLVLIGEYNVTYLHTWGDAFSSTNY